MEPQPVAAIPYLSESTIAWSRVFRVLGGLSIVFGFAELLVTLVEPVQMLFIALNANYPTAESDLAGYLEENLLRWLNAAAALLLVVGGFRCLLRPGRMRVVIVALSFLILFDLLYLGLICVGVWQRARSGDFDSVFAAIKVVLQTILELVFPLAVILLARIRRRQLRTQS